MVKMFCGVVGWGCLRRPILFRLAGKEWGEKGRWVTVWCVLRVRFRQALMFSRCEHTYSPYGRYGTRRLLRYIRFTSSCVLISAVKTPCVRNLQGSTDSPRLCRPIERLRIRQRFPYKRCILPGRCEPASGRPTSVTLLRRERLCPASAPTTLIGTASKILSCFKFRGKSPEKPKRFFWSVQGGPGGNRNPPGLVFFCQRFLLEKQKKMLMGSC